jgi:hypothetical protein
MSELHTWEEVYSNTERSLGVATLVHRFRVPGGWVAATTAAAAHPARGLLTWRRSRSEEMPCQDCERAIAELRAELDALERWHEQRLQRVLDAMDRILGRLEANNHALSVTVEQQAREFFARIDALTRNALDRDPRSTEKEEPPICH